MTVRELVVNLLNCPMDSIVVVAVEDNGDAFPVVDINSHLYLATTEERGMLHGDPRPDKPPGCVPAVVLWSAMPC
jgi:hypothetical protein